MATKKYILIKPLMTEKSERISDKYNQYCFVVDKRANKIEIAKAVEDAKKNLVRVPVYKGTVPHEAIGKFGGGHVLLKPASAGTGVIAGGAMRAVLESAGVHDVLAKSKGSSNPHNVVKATFNALANMRDAYSVAQQRGVSMNKVFNG